MQPWPSAAQILIYALALPIARADDDLKDFSNDLASDIGPLLALFGESMTKQYLSESTSFLDYFIFAMAPIGIITAVVSAIRVCGHSSLRAFIGRSQEGDGVVEAELCTSTSRDVCELFNRGGITRVLGRPSILELIYVPHKGKETWDSSAGESPLHLFRHYLDKRVNPETSEWKREGGYSWETESFAQNPNLSLNVGIKKREGWVFYAVAALGLFLQSGVLVFAAVGVWFLGWNLNEASSASRDYAPVMYITGTVLMCAGMWSCAALIGQTTYELRYERTDSLPPSKRTRLIWLQPGPQVIGDQCFDSFAYFEKTGKDRLEVWTSSRKDFVDFELYTFLAVVTVLVGYIMQFIGLRGMKAWVSLTQLAITVIMSVFRGCLRMQRLSRNDNKLDAMPDTVAGHELDWLSFQLVRGDSSGALSWHVTGQFDAASEVHGSSLRTDTKPSSDVKETAQSEAEVEPVSTKSDSADRPSEDLAVKLKLADLLLIRERLAHLTGQTGHAVYRKLEDAEYQRWEETYVRVRTKTGKLSTAICRVAEALVRRDQRRNGITLRIRAATSPDANKATPTEQPIEIVLKPPSDASQAAWRIDSARLEAILGLWMWTLISDPRVMAETSPNSSLAEKVWCSRIISARLDRPGSVPGANRQGEMDMWLGSNAVTFDTFKLIVDSQGSHGIASLWVSSDSREWKTWPRGEMSQNQEWRRFCGWNSVHGLLNSSGSKSSSTSSEEVNSAVPTEFPSTSGKEVRLLVETARTSGSLLDLCAQELFAALVMSLAGVLDVEQTTTVENAGTIQLNNPTLATFARAFVDGDLGTHTEAMLCLIPAAGSRFTPGDMDTVAIEAAEAYRKSSEWDRAQLILRWTWERHAERPPVSKRARVLRAMGELYRWSLAHWALERDPADERRRFARAGIQWMSRVYADGSAEREIAEVLDTYQALEARFPERHNRQNARADDEVQRSRRTHSLVEALQERDKVEVLYHLCFFTTGDFGSPSLRQALPLAVRNDVQGETQDGWDDVVNAIMEMKANPGSQTKDGRTAISYSAEFGHELYVRRFIDLGVFPDPPDRMGQTPLLLAARSWHTRVVELLLETKLVDIEAAGTNSITPLGWAAMNGHEAVVKMLLDQGADVEAEIGAYGKRVLIGPSRNGHEAVVRLLLEAGADVDGGASTDESMHMNPLWEAVKNGHEGVVRILLDKGADVNASAGEGNRAPLLEAAANGDIAIVEMLLEAGADVEANVKVNEGMTPLSKAAKNGHGAVVRLLLDKGANVKASDAGGYGAPLIEAATNGHDAVVEMLLDAGAEVDKGTHATPLYQAVKKEHEAVVSVLLDKGADVEASASASHWAPLHEAAENGNEAIARMLLDKGADVEARAKSAAIPPLNQAAKSGHEAIVRMLLDRGADVEGGVKAPERSTTPLLRAAEKGYKAVVEMLLDGGADVNAGRAWSATVLHKAAANGHTETVGLLAERGADLECMAFGLPSPLIAAARAGHADTVAMLVRKGASTETVGGTCDATALIQAAGKGHVEVVRVLLDMGARIEAKDGRGDTALIEAAANGRGAVVELFLEKGADVEAKGRHGDTALFRAVGAGHQDIVKLLS